MPEVEFDDDKLAQRRQEFRFQKGWSRAGILSKSAYFEKTHWDSGHKVCTKHTTDTRYKDPMGRCYYCEVDPTQEPRDRFGTIIIKYLTGPSGEAIAPLGPKTFSIHDWWFSGERFAELHQLKKQWGDLRAKDFMFNCTEEKYQRGTLTICPEAWWQMDATFTKIVAAAFKECGIDLAKSAGKFLNYDQQVESVRRRMERDAKKNGQQGPSHGGRPAFGAQQVRDAITPAAQPAFGGAPSFGMPPPSAGHGQAPADLDSLFNVANGGGSSDHGAVQTTTAAPATAADLDSMLNDLNG